MVSSSPERGARDGAGRGRRLAARFDLRALRPPDPAAASAASALASAGSSTTDWAHQQPLCWQQLLRWCEAESHGGSWAQAWLQTPTTDVAEALALTLDGSLRLARRGRWAGRLWRLQIKLQDGLGAWSQPADHPWDAGWLRTEPAALAHLATAFWPRRRTLLLADAAQQVLLAPVLAALIDRLADRSVDRSAASAGPALRCLWVQLDAGAAGPSWREA